ncbi:MAG: methyl-accepting chemotaxis protein [Oscillospiraceae bacterium]
MKKSTSVRMRILRLSLISICVAILSLSGILAMQLDYVSTRAYKNEIQSLSSAYTSAVQASASTIKMQIESAANNEVINNETDVSKLKAELAKLAQTTSFIDFSISEKSGKTLNDTDISDREYFQKALAGETYISRPVLRKTDNSTVIMVATPMTNGKILYGALASDALSAGLTDEFLGEGGLVHIVDKYNEVMASSDSSAVGSAIEWDSTITSGSRELGNNMVAFFLPIDGTDGWSTIVVGNLTDAHSVVFECLSISLSFGVILCIIGVVVSLKVSKKIERPISATTERLEMLAKGDLTSPVEIFERRDETEKLSRSLQQVCGELNRYITNIVDTTGDMANGDFSYNNRMEYVGDFSSIPEAFIKIHEVLKETITNLNDSSSNVRSGSDQIANGAQLLAEGTTRQATAADELSATIANISNGVESTAKGANEASSLSNNCATMMREQDAAMSRMLEAMGTIEQKSEAISNVIKAIEDIAFQTNILALNASIEAARAGEAGKGFAVVASEVGNLAMKSAQSADSTKELITSTLEAVKVGSKIAGDTAGALKEVTTLSEKSAALVKQIAVDADKQAEALKQATQGVEDISQVIQMNSSTAEQSAASCEELSAQAQILAEQVSKLRA